MTASATAVLTRAAMSPENVAAKVAVTAELMPNYRIATPFTIGAQALIATAFVPAKNQSEVFSVGNGGRVYHVFPDAASDTGWSSQDLNFPTQAQCIAAGLLPQGGLVVYVIDANFDVYSRNMGTGDDSGAAWQVFPKIIGQLSPASQPGYVRTINGVYELSVLYDHANIPRPAVVVTDNADEGLLWQALPSLAGWQIHKQPAQGGTRAGFVATPDGAGAPGLFSCAGPDGYLTLLTDINGYAPLVQGLWFPATTVRSSAGFDEVIATTGEVQTRSQAAYFALDASTGQFTPSVIGDPSTFRSFYGSVVASRKANGLMDVFCLNDGKNLLHVRQDPAQQGGWSETLQVSALQFSNIVACSQQPNLTALFAVTTDGRLFHIWQDEDTAGVSDDTVWHVDPVEVAAGGVLEENQTYTARIDFYDAQSTPVPNAKVTVYSDDTVWLEINNASCCVDRTHPWQGSANAMGQLIVTVQRDTIGIPALALWTPGMPDKDRITLDLSAPIQSKLAGSSGEGIIADDLKKAQVKDDDGRASPLLTGSAMADSDSLSHVVLAINRSVGMLTNAGSHQAADRSDWFHALNDARITRYVPNCPPGPLRRLHRPSISDQAWRMSFAGGKLTTADLTADAAQQLVAQARTLAPLSSKWDWDWGDLFDAVRSGLATVYDVVVQPLVDKVQATITVVVNTIHHVVEAVIELAEQVFDLVQEAFRKLQVKFTELCAWLGEKLGWSGVLRTQQAFISLFNGLLDYSVLAVPTLEGFITDKIADLERTLVQQIEGYIPRLVGTDPSILASRSRLSGVRPDVAKDLYRASSMNVLANALSNGLSAMSTAQPKAMFAMTAEATASLEGAMTQLKAIDSEFSAAPAFHKALDFLSSIKDHPQQFMQLSLAALLSAMEGLAVLALNKAIELTHTLGQAIVDALNAIKTLMNTPLPSIPLLTSLYEKHVGGEPTLLGVVALTLALPVTLFHRIRYSSEPFGDDAAVQRFAAAFTGSAMWQRCRLAGRTTETSSGEAPIGDDDLKRWKKAFAIGAAVVSGIYGMADVTLDWPDAAVVANVASGVALACGWFSSAFGWPWFDGFILPDCDPANAFGALHWCLGLLPNVIDSIWLGVARQLPRSGEVVGPCITSVLSAAGLALTIVQAVKDHAASELNALEAISGVFGALPGCFKFLGTAWARAYSDNASPDVLLAIDICCDFGSMEFAILNAYID